MKEDAVEEEVPPRYADPRCHAALSAVLVAFNDVAIARLVYIQGQVEKWEFNEKVRQIQETALLAVAKNLKDSARGPK